MVYSELWDLQEKAKDNINTFFFNHEQVVTQDLEKSEIDKELMDNRKAEITIIESKNHSISENRINRKDFLKTIFIRRENRILKLLKSNK